MDPHLIGETAGRGWQQLAKSGPALLKDLPKAVGAGNEMALMAVGWLAREDKVLFERKGKEIQVSLTERERQTLAT